MTARARRGGFSLLEMVVTMGVLALVMTVMTSIMMTTAKALPSATDADVRLDADDRALREALWLVVDGKQITANATNKLSIVCPDADGDGNDDEITFTYSGNAGESLLMKVSDTEVELIKDVRAFTFDFQAATVATTQVSGVYETAEMLLDGWNGPVTELRKVALLTPGGMRVAPVLPADATAYRITRMRVFVKPNSSGDAFMLWGITGGSGDTPSAQGFRTAVNDTERVVVPGGWVEVLFTGNTYWHAPSERPFVIANAQVTPVGHEFEIGCTTLAPHAGDLYHGTSSIANAAMLYELYGVVRRPAVQPVNRFVGTSLTMSVERTDGTVVRATVPLRNQPEVP